MPQIVDYASLTTAITDWTHRVDLAAGAFTDYFIQTAQSKLAGDIVSDNFGNGIRAMEVAMTPAAITNGGTLPVPSDWFSPKAFQIADGSQDMFTLIFKAAAWIYDVYPIRAPEGLPSYIARDMTSSGEVFIFGPYPDGNYVVSGSYYSKGTPLSASSPTNWMVLKCPETLHACCMVEAAKFLTNMSMLQTWQPVYQDFVSSLIESDKGERWAASTMQIEVG